jgi:uncharacterized membrane protein
MSIKIDQKTLNQIHAEERLRQTIWEVENWEQDKKRNTWDKYSYTEERFKELIKTLYIQEREYERLMTWGREEWDDYYDRLWNRK